MKRFTEISNLERQQRIRALILQNQRVNIDELVTCFDISPATARRDLEALASRGWVQRVHGGAIVVQHAPPEPPVLQRTAEQAEEKRRIAIAAAGLIADGDTVFLSSGTTSLEVAHHLRNRRGLTVITNSLAVLNTLAECPEIILVALGGMFRHSELSFTGHMTEQAMSDLRADKVIFGIRAIHEKEGLMNDSLQETMTDRAILRLGRQIIVVADHTKLGRTATVAVASLSAIHILITDDQAPPDFVAALAAQGIRVITA